MRRLASVFMIVAALMLTTMVTITPAQAATHPKVSFGHAKHQTVSQSIGTHYYVNFNRSESLDIVVQGTTAETAYTVALICGVLALRTGLITGVTCGTVATVVTAFVHDVTLNYMLAHPNICLQAVIKYIPLTSSSRGAFRYC